MEDKALQTDDMGEGDNSSKIDVSNPMALYEAKIASIDAREEDNLRRINSLRGEIQRLNSQKNGYLVFGKPDQYIRTLRNGAIALPQAIRDFGNLCVQGISKVPSEEIARVGLNALNTVLNVSYGSGIFLRNSFLQVPKNRTDLNQSAMQNIRVGTLAELASHHENKALISRINFSVYPPTNKEVVTSGENFINYHLYPAMRPASALWMDGSALDVTPEVLGDIIVPEYLNKYKIIEGAREVIVTSDILNRIAEEFMKRPQRSLTEEEFYLICKVMGNTMKFVMTEGFMKGKEDIMDSVNTVDHLSAVLTTMFVTSHEEKKQVEQNLGTYTLNEYTKNMWRMFDDLVAKSFSAISEPYVVSNDGVVDYAMLTPSFSGAVFFLGSLKSFLGEELYPAVIMRGIKARESEGIDRVSVLRGILNLGDGIYTSETTRDYYSPLISLLEEFRSDMSRIYSAKDLEEEIDFEPNYNEIEDISRASVQTAREILNQKNKRQHNVVARAHSLNLKGIPRDIVDVEIELVRESSSIPITFTVLRGNYISIIRASISVNPNDGEPSFDVHVLGNVGEKYQQLFSEMVLEALRADISTENNVAKTTKTGPMKKDKVKTRGTPWEENGKQSDETSANGIYTVTISQNFTEQIEQAAQKPKSRLAALGITQEYVAEVMEEVRKGSKRPEPTKALTKFNVPIYYIRIAGGGRDGKRFLFYYNAKNDEYILEDCFRRGNSSEFDQFVDKLARKYL